GALERLHGCTGSLHPVGRIAAGANARGRGKGVLAQHDVLTRDVLLVGSTTVVEPHHTGVGRGALRPVDPAVLELELLGRMVPGGQPGDEWSDGIRLDVDDHDPRAVVVTGGADTLVGVGREQATALRPVLEPDVDCGSVGLETIVRCRRLGERPGDLVAVLVEYQD